MAPVTDHDLDLHNYFLYLLGKFVTYNLLPELIIGTCGHIVCTFARALNEVFSQISHHVNFDHVGVYFPNVGALVLKYPRKSLKTLPM